VKQRKITEGGMVEKRLRTIALEGLNSSLAQRWAINLAWNHFEKVTFSGGPYLLMEIEASIA